MKNIISILCLLMSTFVTHRQPAYASGPWNDKSAAIVLSNDDGLNVHLDTVVPLLNQHDIKATFFVNGTAATVANRSN